MAKVYLLVSLGESAYCAGRLFRVYILFNSKVSKQVTLQMIKGLDIKIPPIIYKQETT